jgi:hypothetical protein
MHIPGNFHFHDLNKYISAILIPAVLFQSLEVLIIPFTMADALDISINYQESWLLNITDRTKVVEYEDVKSNSWANLMVKEVQWSGKLQKEKKSWKNPVSLTKWKSQSGTINANSWVIVSQTWVIENINSTWKTVNLENYKEILDRKWKKRKVRLVKNGAGKTREMILGDIVEIGDTLPTQNIIATLWSGTNLIAQDNSLDSPDWLIISAPTSYDLAWVNNNQIIEAFNFWISGEDLVFSKPVKIEISTSFPDGKLLDLQVRHGDEINFSHRWLTLDPSASCDPEWNASTWLGDIIVKWWMILFYTCRASTFILNASGTGNIKLWLKADNGTSCTTNGCSLTTWSDRSNNSNTWTALGTVSPTYVSQRWNFNPWVRFSSGYFHTVNDGGVAGDMSLIAVYNTVQSVWDATFWNSPAIIGSETSLGQLDFALGMNTGHLIFKSMNGDMLGTYETWTTRDNLPHIAIGTRTLSGNSLLYRNGRLVGSRLSDWFQLTNPTRFGIGQHETVSAGGQFVGDIMEAIVYSGALSLTNVNKISSYLALKYGITLDQTVATNYTLSGWNLAWNATAWLGYNANIAGIARDDGFSLSQKKSQSATNTGDIIIEYTGSTFVSDNHSLVWWNNNGATWTWITTEIPGWFQRIAREWKIQELNGDVWDVNIFMPLSGFANTWGQVVNMIVVWTGELGDFSGATTFVAGILSWSNLLFNYNFTDGDYITFAIPYTYTGSTKMFWLKSNNGTYIDAWVTLATTDGQTIQQWNDYSTSVFNMTQLTAANRPIYRKNSLNNNPGLQFTNSTHYLSRATGISWTTNPVFTYYFVGSSQKAIGSTGTLLWFRNTTLGWYPMFTSSLNSFSIYLEATTPITARYSRAITNPNKWILSLSRSWTGVYISSYNGSIATATNAALFTAATTGQPMYIGNRRATAADTNSFSWVMNEMLIYTWVITGNEHQKILSYLACKYGTTLDQTTPYNYLLSNNVVSWNASEDTNYKTNIGCIARDSWFSLYQTGSRSNSNSWDILVEQTWSLTDMRSLSWANNNAATGTWTTTEVPGNKIRRFAREWRFQENNGDIGNIRMTYASWSLPTGFTGTLVLVRDNDGNFSTGQIAWSTGTLSGTNWEFSTSIGDSEYVTFMELGGIDAVNDTFILTEDLTWSTNVLTNDTGSSLSVYRIATLPTNWNLYLSGSTGSTLVTLATTDFNIGNLVYRWNQDYCGADSFYYQLSDTGLLLNRYDYATGSITVNCINDAPIANDDSLIVSEDSIATTMNLIANDTDVDSWDSLSISWIVSTTSNGILTIDSSTGVSYSPDANFCWTDTFTYTTADLFGPLESNIATWTITINCINDAPVANNDTPSVTEDSISNIFSILSNDTDSDIGDTLSISGIIATTSNGTLTTSGTTQVVYTPDANFCGTDTFTYRARDSFWPTASNTATGTITVTCVNDAPVANNDIRTATGTEDTLLTIFVTANDTDIDNAITSITGLTQPSTGGTLSITWGVNVLYTPTANFCTSTPLTFTYRALDASSSQSNIATGSFIVSCVNDAPVASNDSNTTSRNTNVTTFVLANDTDIDHTLSQLSVTWITSITGGTASIVGTGVLFTPTAWVCGTGTFTYRALDASGSLSNTATGTITISCTNSAPVANNDTPSVTEDSISNIFSILSNDTDSDIGDTLSISGIIATTSNGTLTTSGTTQVVYTPDANFCGTDTFTYRARDSFWPTASNTATGTITVTCVNDAPVANNDIRTATGTEDTLLTIFVTANDTDIDNAITSITGLTQPSTGGTLSITWGVNVLYTPTANFCTSTPLTFTYRALDASSSQSNIATGSFIVSCVNDAPVASNDSNTTSRNTNVTTFVLANDTDIDHTLSQLSVTWITSITGGTASIVGTGVLFTPTAWVCGTGTFTYRALDASGSLSNTATGTITISCTNSAPVANNDTPSVTEDSISNIFSILSNDTDSDIGDTLSISGIIATTSNGTLTTSGTTQVVYTPDANFCGTDTFTYRARDSFWPTASNTATGTITVTCVNDAPVANNDIRTATGTEDTLLTIFVTANDTDIDNAITSITGLTQPSTGGTLSITWGVNVLYTPTANFCTSTPLTFTYRALDASSSQSNIATGSFIVSCVNDAPVASNDSNTTSRNTNVTTFVLANDTDIDHTLSQLSVTWITSITGGTASIVGTGVLFTPTAWVCGTGTFTYRALDASGSLSNTATGTITISCTNSAPVANNDTPSVTEDSISNIFSILSNDTDSDIGDTLSISGIIATTSNGTLTTSGTTQVVYTPDANFCGTDTFTYRARDSFWPTASNTATGTITVTCVNDAPVANNDIRTATGTEDTLLTIFVTANDTDIDNAITSITGLTQPSTGGTLSITWGVNVLYTPTANFCTSTPLTFTYRALDASSSQSNIATGSFIVSCVNDAPVASNDSNTTSRNTNVTTFVLANDTDIDHTLSQLSVTWITSITGGTASIVGTGVLFTPTAWVCGTGTFTYRALDASGSLSNTATGTITISCTNSAPVANNDTPSVTEDSISNIFSILSNDTDSDIGDTLSISGIIATTSNGTLTTSGTTQVVYTPDANFCGTDTFTYRARDSFWPTASNTATGTITVTCVNDAPVANNDIRTATGTEDSILTIAVLSNDTDSDNLPSELSLTGLTQVATGGTLTISGATHVLYTPTANFCSATPLTFTYRTEDIGNATSNIATGSFIVNCVNDAPVALDDIDGTMRNVAVLVDVLSNDTDSDNLSSELSITGLTNTVLGTVITQSGKVRFTPSVGLCGTGSFDYQTADTDGGISNTATALITINCVNDAPVANADSLTVAEDASATTLDLIANDTDSDGGDTLSISGIINTTANGTLTVTSTTEVSYTPDLNFCGTDTFTYRARDSFWPTASNTATGTITVTCVNDAPVANNDIRTATGTEDSILTIAVLSNDTDSDNLPSELSLTGLTQVATGGTLTISGATHVLYTPTANFCSATPLTFTYRTEDIGNATSNIATGSFIVNCVNDAPVALDDIDGTMRNVAVLVDVLSNDTDSDNLSSELSITGLTNTVLGTVITQSGKVRFTPSVGLCGTGSFDYQTADTDGGISNTATALITINCVNDAPVANADSLTVAEDASATTLDLIANDTDSDGGDTLSISGIINTTANGTLTVTSTTEVSYTPDLNFCGTDTFTYRARDSFWPTASNTATGTITVTCVNDAPVANNDIRTATGTEDSILTIAVLSNDTDSDNLPSELSLTGLTQVATGGTLTISGATHVLYTPTANFCSATPLTFTYRTEDIGNATSNIATGSFIVNCVNDAPVALDDIDGTMRNVAVLVDVLSNDTDSDNLSSELSITGLTNTVLGTVITQSGKVRFTPSVGLCGTGSFDYQTADTDGGISNTATALITINCVNDAPVANADSLTVAEDASATTLDLIANDTDSDGGDTLSISGIINTTANGTLTVTSTTEVSYTPDLNFCGTDTFTYRARDSFWPTASNTATGTITVTCVNDAPVANNDIRTATGTEDSILTIAVLSNDTDSDNLPSELSLTGLTQVATGGTLTISGATHVLYTPTANFCSATPLTFTYRTEDIGNATSNIATGSFIVNCVNDAPVALDDIDGTMRNVAVLVDVLSNDTDSDNLSSELSITGLTNTVLGTVITQSGKVRFTPSVGLCGTGSFDYQTADTDGGISNTATALITINCVNDAPVANADSLTVAEDASATTLDLIANDTDSDGGDTLSISGIINTTANGTLTVTSTTEVSYTPDLNFCGTDTFTYRARDSFWPTASNTATGTITVTCVNDAPVANNDIRTATGTEDSILTIAVLSNDTDSDNLPSELSLTGLTQVATGGTLTISGATHVLYTPTANFCSATPLTFTYRTEDIGNATSNIATGSFIVNCVNDAPVALDDIDGTMRNVAVLVDVLSNDTDSDNLSSELSITGLTNTVLGTVITQSGKVRFTPSVGLCGTGSFDYQTADTDGGISNTATALITINCVNDAPVANADSLTVAEDASATTLDLIANDTDSDGGDTLSISGIINTTANGTLTVTSTTEVSYTPDLNFCGTDTFTYRARDSFWPTASNTATGTITVTCVNDAPVANNDIRTATGTEDSILTIAVLSNDTDSDNLPSELSLTGLTQVATGGTLTISGATHVLYTPTANFCSATPLTFTYRTEDIGNATSNIATGSFIVNCVNDAPVALDDIDGTMRNVAVLVDVLSNDTDSDNLSSELSITGLTNTVLGTVITQSGKVRFTPSVGLCGTGSFDYQTADTDGGISNTATALITINCVNDAPVANADSLTVAEDASATTLDLIANDTDSDGGDTLSISGIINTTANGTLTVTSTTEVSYTPDLNFCGTDTFTYRARDSFWPTASNTATGTITVTCVNDAPVANNDIRTATGTEDSILTIAVLSNDTDSDNLPSELSLTGLTQVATGGTLTISGATHVLYTPTANFCSATPLTFTYRTEDIGNATSNIATGSFIVNCVPPDSPTILTLGNDNHFPFTISDATPIMSWTGEANTIVNYYTSSWVLIATWATDSNGEFVMPILLPLPEGEFTYIITLTDIYGYESSGTILQFLLDTTAPWIPTVQPLPLVSITGSVSVSWSTSPNSSIEILSASWNVLCSTQSTSTGFYSCWPLIPPPLTGTHSLIVRACDNVITPNCSSNLSTQLVVDTLLWSTGAAHPWSNWSSSASSSSFTPSSTPNVSPSVFAPLFTIPEALPDILESAPDIFKDNFLKLLPTQTLVNLDSSMRDGYSVYNLSERVTPYVCPQIVQMYKEDELLANDIPTVDFTDDVKALIMFRWLEKNERVIGQKYSEYQKFGIALNDESYEPYRSITRAEFVKMLVRSLSCRYMFVGTDTKFSDVNRDMWYAEYIAFAVENEWINGYSDGTFRPDALITRAEAAKILARSIKLRISPRTISTFIDVPNSSVFVPYIESLRDSNIINGKTLTTFEPNSHVVRTEASRIIYKTFLGWWRKVSEK